MAAQTEPRYVICWRWSDLTGATVHGTEEFSCDEALSVCKTLNEKYSRLQHWISLVRHEPQEPTP